MNTSNEDTDASSTDASSESAGAPESAPESVPVTREEWDRLRAPFSWKAYIVDNRAVGYAPRHLSGEEEGDDLHPAVIDLRLRPEAIRDRLDLALGPERWSYRLEVGPQAGGRYSLLCHLQVGSARRSGTGTGSSLSAARRIALAGAAEAFGIGASGLAAGPMTAEIELRNEVPDRILEALEEGAEPSRWTPDKA
jgi:hypothetical protein